MRSTDLTREQASRLTARIQPSLEYLNRLCERMNAQGFPVDDTLYAAARRAREATQDVYTAALRCGIRHGMGADPDTKDDDQRRA